MERRKVVFVPSFYRDISVFHFSLFSFDFPFAGSHKTIAAGAKTLLVLDLIPETGKPLFCGASGPFLRNSFVYNINLQYAALRSQYLSKISENAVPADLRDRLCYAPNCLLGKFLHSQSSRPSRPCPAPALSNLLRKRALCPNGNPSIAIQLRMQLCNAF